MTQPVVQRLAALLDRMRSLAAARQAAGEAAERQYAAARQRAEEQFAAGRQALEQKFADELAAVRGSYQQSRDALLAQFESEHGSQKRAYEELRERIAATYAAARTRAKKEFNEAQWDVQTVYDAKRPIPRREYKELERQVTARLEHVQQLELDYHRVLIDLRQEPERLLPGEPPADLQLVEAARQLNEAISTAEETMAGLRRLRVPNLFRGSTPMLLIVASGLLAAFPAGWLSGGNVAATAISVTIAMLLSSIVFWWLYYVVARRQVDRVNRQFAAATALARRVAELWLSAALARAKQRQEELKQRFTADMAELAGRHEQAKIEARARRDEATAEADQRYLPLLSQQQTQHEQTLNEIEHEHPARIAALEAQRDEQLRTFDEQHQAALEGLAHRRNEAWQQVAQRWNTGVAQLEAEAAEVRSAVEQFAPAWDDPAWNSWRPSDRLSEAIRYGQFDVALDKVPGIAPLEDRLRGQLRIPRYTLPAVVPFPQRASLLIKTAGAGRVEAVQVLQAMMLRFLVSLPPGKVRFTIIDPVGLGQNFAGFMHLADFDDKLVGARIWTEPQFIEQQLADMTAHMSTVIQKYLRNEYESIEQYNEQAGEVAEPFRVVVAANFPFNFTEAAARHLLSISTSGARCGVYTLVSVDMKQRAPQSFNVADLEQQATKLVWKDDCFNCREGDWSAFPLSVDLPPEPEQVTRLLHVVGEAAKDANRVEVPFDFIAPAADAWWTSDSRAGIDVPLGRAGATRRQHLQLGKGTSQHVLIAGKTGSGKSTLLHALITNLALYYSPDEVELYLVDFKKGVEFKTYATHQLPHARVVAIESEREFGLSVLQRLDAELKWRGDRFRDVNAQDIGAFRKATGQSLPRLLLIVDEFQEFFVEDDKVAQEAALLFDRLVRQGRAFGIHVHLGSQTLGGAYSLARSTLGQMAVRVALQCSEADAHLILSEDNAAARLLTRPGEAIYNDANGRVEGNHLFQVVWLSDQRREEYLKQIARFGAERGFQPRPQIVFEGNVPADPARNDLLAAALAAETWSPARPVWLAWLGEPIAIKDPTSLEFRRQSGNHVLIVGQQAESALALCAASVLSLAAQMAPDQRYGAAEARFYLLEGSPADSPQAGYLQSLAAALPHTARHGGVRDAAVLIDELAAEVKRRQDTAETDVPELFLIIYDIPRFRDLRRQDDDFGIGRKEEKPSPAKQLVMLLREGPAVGVHAVVWCDTLNNLNRTFDRQSLREFENRILFQMNAADSSNLIDSPLASKLGMNRALVISEDQGRTEKFRPYGLPEAQWLAEFTGRLRARPVRELTPENI